MERDKGRDIGGVRMLIAGEGTCKYDCVCRESLDQIVAIFGFVYMYVHMHNYVHYTLYIKTIIHCTYTHTCNLIPPSRIV